MSSSANNAVILSQSDEDLRYITNPTTLSKRADPTFVRRFLLVLSYVMRKTDKLVWYDLMHRWQPEADKEDQWVFGRMVELLEQPKMLTTSNLDLILYIFEEMCTPLVKLGITEANKLVKHNSETTLTDGVDDPSYGKSRYIPSSSSSFSYYKKARTAPMTQVSEGTDGEKALDHSLTLDSHALPTLDEGKAYMPFPVLNNDEAAGLVRVVCSEECSGGLQRKCLRVLRTLSLSDSNWSLLMNHLRDEGARRAAASIRELGSLHSTLTDVALVEGTAAVAMATPRLSSPSTMSEPQLLQVLRLMSSLRSTSSVETEAQQASANAAVAVHLRNINS